MCYKINIYLQYEKPYRRIQQMTVRKIMTPKEEALELIEKFKINDYDWIAQGNLYCVKQHALVTVNKILNIIYKRHLINGIEANEYWSQVKSEIEAL